MSFLETLTDLFESIFKHSSPQVQKKQLLKKLEAELKTYEPSLFKNGNLQPNFAEAINALYKNTKALSNLFDQTVSSNDLQRQHRFEAQLILTGYSAENQDIISKLDFESKKLEVMADPSNPERVYMRQRKNLEKVLKDLNSESFKNMDKDILSLRQLVDFCRISFVPILQLFDINYKPDDFSYVPSYAEIPVSKVVNLLEDLYYQISGMHITTANADQVRALVQLKKGGFASESEADAYVGNLKKINYVITRVLTPDKLKTLIRYVKQDLTYEPDTATYSGSPRQDFANLFQVKFDAEEQRIKSEIQDERITQEVANLFKDTQLEVVFGYSAENNAVLQENTSLSFMWILPLRILKTFLNLFVSDGVKNLLNDIVIEGFFNNPQYKSDFSQVVYAAISAADSLKEFEESFAQGKPNSTAVMFSYIKDSHKDKDFYRRLEKMVIMINNEAHKMLQSVTTTLHSLYKDVGELLADAKKPSSEIISNLKVLMLSSRNKDNTNLLENQYESWNIFFEIMKNYVIINSGEKQS